MVPCRVRALHIHRDEKATTDDGAIAGTSSMAAIAVRSSSGASDDLPYVAAAWRRVSAATPGAGTTSTTRRASSVRVPVLSRHSTSVAHSDSMADNCCASAPRRAMRSAEMAYATLTSRIRPSGTRVTTPAVASATAARKPMSCRASTTAKAAPRGTISATMATSRRFTCTWRGERGCRNSRAWPAMRCA